MSNVDENGARIERLAKTALDVSGSLDAARLRGGGFEEASSEDGLDRLAAIGQEISEIPTPDWDRLCCKVDVWRALKPENGPLLEELSVDEKVLHSLIEDIERLAKAQR